MDYISSDTNVWIDFYKIDKLSLPFRLSFTYIMNEDAIEEELLTPCDLKQNLLDLGLKSVHIDNSEFILAIKYGSQYKQLSIHDRIALAIAKNRNIALLSGDYRLRKAAEKEGVNVIGTIAILDMLYVNTCISENEYDNCLRLLRSKNGQGVRLPNDELELRLTQEGKLYVKSAYALKNKL